MKSSTVALISCISSSERPRKGRAGMRMRTCFLETHLPPTRKRRAFFLRARIVRPGSPNWCVAACLTLVPTAKPVASDFDLMELRELRGLDERFPALGLRPYGCLPPLAARVSALFEAFQGGLPDTFGESCVDALLVDLRETPYFSEHRLGVPFESDAIHGSHPPHFVPAENPGVRFHREPGRRCGGRVIGLGPE